MFASLSDNEEEEEEDVENKSEWEWAIGIASARKGDKNDYNKSNNHHENAKRNSFLQTLYYFRILSRDGSMLRCSVKCCCDGFYSHFRIFLPAFSLSCCYYFSLFRISRSFFPPGFWLSLSLPLCVCVCMLCVFFPFASSLCSFFIFHLNLSAVRSFVHSSSHFYSLLFYFSLPFHFSKPIRWAQNYNMTCFDVRHILFPPLSTEIIL